jgi:arylamine N-acetyltransferase
MEESPLAPPPPGSECLRLFLDHFAIRSPLPPRDLLLEVTRAFARIPYENLTKIIRKAERSSVAEARRRPLEVVRDHLALGAGGTCFSLTATLLHLLRALGFRAEPLLADRHYGPDTHCALAVWIDGAPHLLDPGYLVLSPVPLAGLSETRVATAFNEVILTPRADGTRIDLSTSQGGPRSRRLTFKASPADPGEFLRAWDESFGWEMMRYPLLTRVRGGSQLYLQEGRLQVRSREATACSEIGPEELPARIASEFGLEPALVERALAVLRREEGPGGRPAAR